MVCNSRALYCYSNVPSPRQVVDLTTVLRTALFGSIQFNAGDSCGRQLVIQFVSRTHLASFSSQKVVSLPQFNSCPSKRSQKSPVMVQVRLLGFWASEFSTGCAVHLTLHAESCRLLPLRFQCFSKDAHVASDIFKHTVLHAICVHVAFERVCPLWNSTAYVLLLCEVPGKLPALPYMYYALRCFLCTSIS